MNRKILVLFIFIIVLVPFLHPLFKPEIFISHDSEPQIVRIGAFYKAIIDGQFPPRWAGDLNYKYGAPTLIFFFPLEGYLGTFFHIIGFSLQDSYKIIMGASFILASFFFYLWMSQIFEKKVAFLSALFYGLAPYHFLDMYIRGQLGEMLAFVFIPLVFLIIEKNCKKQNVNNILLGGVFYSLLVLSHNILSLLFSFIFAFYILISGWREKRIIIFNIWVLLTGLLISIFFWLPALYEGKYINSRVFVGDMFKDNFLNLSKIIYSSWDFGDNVNKTGGLSPQIGLLYFLLFLAVIIVLIKNKATRKKIVFWLFVTILSSFMTTSFSSFIWYKLHIIQQFQFPWRFIAVSSFAVSVVITFLLSILNNKTKIFLLLIIFIFSFNYTKVKGFTNKYDSYYLSYSGTAAYHGESTTIWVAGDASSFPKAQFEIISGKAILSNMARKSNKHSFSVSVKTDKAKFKDNTVYFPGWRVEVDGKKVPIEFQDINHRGLITFEVPNGFHDINVIFGESPIRIFSNIASLLTILIIGIILIFRKRLNKGLKAV